ncbi:MAG: phenylalanine--tRNA ligase subunit beta [Clostridiales bacterium]|nr:phenylalanine--tRNA ligase subunit beta [Clostridiales bacterium]
MYISMNWIKDFVNLDGIETEELIKRFNLTTAEIEGYEVKGQDTAGVIFARIEKVENHPNSDHLHILAVNTGSEVLQIVCGAPNVRENMTVCLAPIGSKVGGHKMTKAKLAGTESFGMCCSEAELGLGSDDSGIMDIDFPVTLGADISTVFPINDIVFEVDNKSLTNRPDLWGQYGMAREFAAMFNRELKPLETDNLEAYNNLPKLEIKVNDANCYRYSGITVKNITKKVSPQVMKIRLVYCGMRDINLLTDLTNYLMLELGQPMHAFDNNLVKGIHVNSAVKGTKLLTLEGEEHDIPEGATVICDNNDTPVAIAGIKGGKLSGITEETNSLLLESATFDAKAIRITSNKVGLKTDSSQRYEKSLDPEMTTLAIARLLKLLKDIDGGVQITSALTDVNSNKYPKINIEITSDFVSRRIGLKVTDQDVTNILTKLGFKVANNNGVLNVDVPSYRATKDISLKEDLVEEIARSYGYDNIEPKPIAMEVKSIDQNVAHNNEYQAKYLLAEKYGMNEVHSYLWNYVDFNKQVGIDSKSHISLVDSSNAGQSGIRSELTPTLLKFMEENKNSFENISIFEIGKVVTGLDEQNLAIEKSRLAICLASQTKSTQEIYFALKDALLDIAENVYGVKLGIGKIDCVPTYMHPVNSTNVYAGEKVIGQFGLIHPSVKMAIDKRFNIAVLEVDTDELLNAPTIEQKVKKVSKFQDVNIDYSFLVPSTMKYAEIEKHLAEFRAKVVWTYKLVDIYESADLGDKASWTFKFNLCSLDKTLSAKDIDIFCMRLLDHMNKIGLQIRQ